MSKLNIVLITTDQHRGDCVGVDGNPVIRTPCLDALARDPAGLYFTAAYAEAPVCVPQRTAWTLGRHPLNCRQNRWREFEWKTDETICGVLAAQGWRCGVFGKRHYHPVREPYGAHEFKIYESGRHGIEPDDYLRYLREETDWGGYSRAHGVGNNDVFAAASILPEQEYPSSWIARESISFLERHAKERAGQPFFLWTSFNKPHSPYDPPQPYDRLYKPQEMPAPYLSKDGLAAETPVTQRMARHYTWDTQGVEQMRTARAYYYGMITHIDHCIERVVKTLERLGLRENTLIAFTSDHGDMMGDHHSYFKAVYYEGSARVPYIWWIPPQRRKEMDLTVSGKMHWPVGVSSLTPSLLEIAGAQKAATMNADSLLPIMRGAPRTDWSEVVGAYALHDGERAHSAMLRWRNLKYIYWQDGGIQQLFDVADDPGELKNLIFDKTRNLGSGSHPVSNAIVAQDAHERLEKRLAEFESGRQEVLNSEGKLVAADGPLTCYPPIKGPWGRRPN